MLSARGNDKENGKITKTIRNLDRAIVSMELNICFKHRTATSWKGTCYIYNGI